MKSCIKRFAVVMILATAVMGLISCSADPEIKYVEKEVEKTVYVCPKCEKTYNTAKAAADCCEVQTVEKEVTVYKYVCPKDKKEYATAQEAADCCGVQIEYVDKEVEKIVKKYVCPRDGKEYNTAEEAANCCGVQTVEKEVTVYKYVCPKDKKEYATAQEAADCCGVQIEYVDKEVEKIVKKYVCPRDGKEYDTAEEAANCCGSKDKSEGVADDFIEINYSEGNFFISSTELTYTEWYEVYQWAVTNGYIFQDLGREGSNGTDGAAPTEGSKQPVTYVSWRDAVVWCNAASEKAGLTPVYEYEGSVLKEAENCNSWGTNSENTTSVGAGRGKAEKATVNTTANGYRLPTESEWEYAAKGGADYTYSGSDTIGDVAWYYGNSGSKTHDVGTKDANGYGLHDMSGNVWEWCQDTWASDSSNRVFRGGSWGSDADHCAVSNRTGDLPVNQFNYLGFRVVRSSSN